MNHFSDTGCAILDIIQRLNSHHKRYVKINVLHVSLGDLSEATTRLKAKEMNVMVSGFLQPCKACALGKAKKAKGIYDFFDIS